MLGKEYKATSKSWTGAVLFSHMLSQAPPTFLLQDVFVFQRVYLRLSLAEELNTVVEKDHNQEEDSVAC